MSIIPRPDIDITSLRRHRLNRLVRQTQKHDLAMMILTNPVSLRYAIDLREYALFQSHIPTYFLYVFRDGKTILHGASPQHGTDCDDVRPAHFLNVFDGGGLLQHHADLFADDVTTSIRQSGDGLRVAVERTNPSVIGALERKGITVTDAEPLVERARQIKSDEEIQCIQHAIAVAQSGMETIREHLAPGITENELWSFMHQVNIANDGDWIDGRMLCSGYRTNPWFQEASNKVIEAGDLVAFDTDMIGPFGYCADISRTLFCDGGGIASPTQAQKTAYRKAYDEVHHNIDLIRPGMSFLEFSQKAFRQTNDVLINRYVCIAHGVGMSDEYPKIYCQQDWERYGYDDIIQANTVLSVESYVGSSNGSCGVKLEQMVWVKDGGVEVLSDYPFEQCLLT